MDRSLAAETRTLLASARALLSELAEEGIDELPPPETEGVRATTVSDTSTPQAAKGRAQRAEAERSSPAQAAEGRAQRAEAERSSPAQAAEGRAQRAEGERSSPEPADELPRAPDPSTPQAAEGRAQRGEAERSSLGLDAHAWGDAPTLEAVREELGECTRCRLCEGRTQIVFGDGNPQADLMFVGEGPGQQEDLRGLPFVGRAGELLTQMIEKGLGIPRSSVYICNVVKCRPPQNRTPLAEEVSACSPFLDGQIAAVKPRVIVALGRPAASLLLGRNVAISRIRGRWHDYRGIPLMPTFHPAFLLRQYTPENRRLVWDDLKAAWARAQAGTDGAG